MLSRSALKTGECIVMMLKAVAIAMSSTEGVVSRVVGVFQQRLFHPISSLDGTIVTELGNMAAKLGDMKTLEVSSLNDYLHYHFVCKLN